MVLYAAVNDRLDERMKVELLSFVLLTVDTHHSAKCPQIEQEAKDTKWQQQSDAENVENE